MFHCNSYFMLVKISDVTGYYLERDIDGMFYCPRQCGRKYKFKKGLVRHLKFECGIEPQFKCPICHTTFKQQEILKIHLNANHGIDKYNKSKR